MDWLTALQLVGQGVAVALIARVVYQLGHIVGIVDGLAKRLESLEGWRDSNLTPRVGGD